jgi:hypothetical protein
MCGRSKMIATELGDEPGMLMTVNARDAAGKPDCSTSGETATLTVGGPGEALWFVDLTDDNMVLNRTTGPVGSVAVYNFSQKKLTMEAIATELQTDWWGVTFWKHEGQATAETCADFADNQQNGLGSVVIRETRFEFATGTTLANGRTGCEPVQ